MDESRARVLAQIMERVAAGDDAAAFALVDRFGDELRRAVVGVLRARHTMVPEEDVQGLVLDVVIALVPLASAWQAGQAPPWVWARHRVSEVVDRHLGQWGRPLDEESAAAEAVAPPPAAGADRSTLAVVDELAEDVPAVRLLVEAVRTVASERDVEVFFDVLFETAGGCRAPAAVVGRLHDLAPATVRQQHRRVRVRLQELVARDPRFASLAELAVVA